MKIKIIALLAALTITVASCQKYPTDTESQKSFNGEVIVDNGDGSTFNDPGIRVSVSESVNDKGKYDILMKKVKFAKAMPVRLNITIPSVEIDAEGKISGKDIVPWAMGGPFREWTISTIGGTLVRDAQGEPLTLQFDMVCGEYPVTYSGTYMPE